MKKTRAWQRFRVRISHLQKIGPNVNGYGVENDSIFVFFGSCMGIKYLRVYLHNNYCGDTVHFQFISLR